MSGENELVEEAKMGNFEAFGDLISPYEKKIYNYCLRMTKRREDAEDLTQEVFVRVYKGLKGFKGNSQFSTWIFRIAHNICIDHYRKSKFTTVSLNQPKSEEDQREMDLPLRILLQKKKPCVKNSRNFCLSVLESYDQSIKQ